MEQLTIQELRNPFLGLQPFSKDQSHLYFGRSKHITFVIDKLLNHRFCAILGKSGIGKSSFVYCGVFPELEKRGEFDIISITPGASNPLIKFIDHFFIKLTKDERKSIYQDLLIDQSNCEVFENYTHSRNTVIYIDQFEELFNYIQNDDDQLEHVAFIELLVNLRKRHNLFIMISMRSDFLGQCADYFNLTSCINESQFLIPKMSHVELEECIVGPLNIYDVKIEDDLVSLIINDLVSNEEELPSLQHALMRTFEEWKKENLLDIPINKRHYYKIGGIKDSLSNHANEIYDLFEEEEKYICEKVFRCITTINKEGKGIRNPTSLNSINSISGINNLRKCRDVINKFRQDGRAFLLPSSHDVISNDTIIDITHESFMRSWSLLKAWTEKEVDSIKKYKKLSEDAEEYQKGNRSRLRNPELQLAINWREEQKPTYEWGVRFDKSYERTISFLSFSETEEVKEMKRLKVLKNRQTIFSRVLIVIFLILGMCGVLLGTHAYQKSKLADKKRVEAEKSKHIALTAQQKAEEHRELAEKEKTKAEIEKKKALVESGKAVKASRLAKEEEAKAIIAMEKAELSFNEASIQKEKATIAMKRATTEKNKAERANKLANRLQNLATSRAMALNSYQVTNLDDRFTISKQAIYGYINNIGKGFDSDFYNAFHQSIKKIKGENYNTISQIEGMIDEIHHVNNEWYILSPNSFVNKVGADENIFQTNLLGLVKGFSIVNSQTLFYYTYDGNIYHYDKKGNKHTRLNTLTYKDEIIGISNISNKSFVVFDKYGEIKKYIHDNGEWNEFEVKNNIKPQTNTFLKLEVDQRNKGVFLSTKNGNVYLFDSSTDSLKLLLTLKNDPIWSLKSVGNDLYVGTESGKLLKLNYTKEGTWRTILNIQAHDSRLSDVAVHPMKNIFVSVGFDGVIKIWKQGEDVENLISINEPNWVTSTAFTSNGNYFFTGDQLGYLKKWSIDLKGFLDEYEAVGSNNISDETWDFYVGEEINYDETFKAFNNEN